MADSTVSPTCVLCGVPLDEHSSDREMCHDCRSPNGKIADLDIAIRASGDHPKRIGDWPVIRHLLRARFGEDRSDEELWERCTDWLRAEGRLTPNDYLRLPLDYLQWLLENGFARPNEQSSGDRLESLRTVRRELEYWIRSNSPSETGYVVDDVPVGHPLHAAVVALQPYYGGALPKPALGHWRMFRKLARNENEAAEDRAERLLEWANGEIESHRDGAASSAGPDDRATGRAASPDALEATSDGQMRLADWAVAEHGVLLDQINLGPRPGFGNKFPISDFDAVVVDGDTPTVCPKTDRPIPAEWLPTIEEVFKRVGPVKTGQTIHWVGGQTKLENVCTCFREGFPSHDTSSTGDKFIERLHAGPNDAELSHRELALLEAYLQQPVSLSQIQRETRAEGESESTPQRNKLKLICDFNRNLQAGREARQQDNEQAEATTNQQVVEAIERQTPELDTESVEWLAARKENEEKLGLPTATLRTYRLESKGGRKMPGEMFGIDHDGRRWRRKGTQKSMVYYYVPSLPKASK